MESSNQYQLVASAAIEVRESIPVYVPRHEKQALRVEAKSAIEWSSSEYQPALE